MTFKQRMTDQKYFTQIEAIDMGVNISTESLNLCKNGQLVHSRWYYDELLEKGWYIFLDVTDKLPKFLFERTSFVTDLRLKDIFMLIKNNIDFLEPILENWCREIVEEGLSDIKPYSGEYDPAEIEYLELYRFLSVEPNFEEPDSTMLVLEGGDDLNFHGVGFVLKEDHEYNAAGTRINWGLGFIQNKSIADTPIKINSVIKLYERDDSREHRDFKCYDPKLIDILHGIVYELSWYGPPEVRDEKKKDLVDATTKLGSVK